ncbi:hypothetical protein [Streptomyces acidicola]|uniref:Uncharacterized protein n=1 Tax=Streptomyces acidicola TaxID=2596892 RepID=A0A5N8WSK4_9ACTN|nr:hypothetical protein [Streptomyces acidicola]MPY49215.1 hypothetical protein [Streptomyces acidicola]
MLNSKKIAVVAGLLGGFALVGGGAVQAFAADGAGKCVDDGRGHVRCEDVVKRDALPDTYESVQVVNSSTQNCPPSSSGATCVSDVAGSGKKS